MDTGLKKPLIGLLLLFLALGLSPFTVLAGTPGEELYFQSCALCHGDDGSGAMPRIPDMSGAGGPLWKSDGDLISTIINGVERPDLPTPMPAKGGNDDLTPEQARSVLEFMRREFGN